MTVLCIARKNNKVCIAADTTITINGNLASADINQNNDKIFKYKDNYFAYTGPTQSHFMLQHALENHGDTLSFSGQANIYNSLLTLHKILKDHYFAMTKTSNNSQPVEDVHINFLLANPSGIYQILGDRYVGEMATYWSAGSGAKYALGAMSACYDTFDDPADIATAGVKAGCQFDHYCDLPMTLYECDIKTDNDQADVKDKTE